MQFTQLLWVCLAWLLDHNGNYPRSFKQLMRWPRTHHTQRLEDCGPSCRIALCRVTASGSGKSAGTVSLWNKHKTMHSFFPHLHDLMLQCTHVGKSRKNALHQWLWRGFSGSAPCRICCLSWSTAFSSHIKDFTRLKQSWHLQCESYLKGVRFDVPNGSLSDILTGRLQLDLCLSPEYPYISPELQLFSKFPSYKSDADLQWLTYKYRKNGFLAILLVLLQMYFSCWRTKHLQIFYCPHYSWSVDS